MPIRLADYILAAGNFSLLRSESDFADSIIGISKLNAALSRRIPADPSSANSGYVAKVSGGPSGSRTWIIAAETAGQTTHAVRIDTGSLTSGDNGGFLIWKDGTAFDWALGEWATRNGFGVSYDSSNDTFTIFVPQHLHDLLLQYGAGGWTRVAGAVAQTHTAALSDLTTVAGYTYGDYLAISPRAENRHVYVRLTSGTSLVAKRRQVRVGEQDGVTGEFAGFDSRGWTLIGTTGGQTYYGQLAPDLPAGDSVTLVEDDPASLDVRTPAELTTVDASGFSGNLSGTDTDVQAALDTIDGLTLGGGGGSGTPAELDVDALAVTTRAISVVSNATWHAYQTLASYTATDDAPFIISLATNPTFSRASGGGGDRVLISYRVRRTRGAAATTVREQYYYPRYLSNFGTDAEDYQWPHNYNFLLDDVAANDVLEVQVRFMMQDAVGQGALTITWDAANTDIAVVSVSGGGGSGQTGQQVGDSGILTDLSIGQNQIADSVWAAISPLDDLDATTNSGQVLAIVQSRHAGLGLPYNELTQYPVRLDTIPVTGTPPTPPGAILDISRDAFIPQFLRFTAADEGFRLNGLTAAGSAITWEMTAFIRPRAVGTKQVLASFPASATSCWDLVLDTDGRLRPEFWNGTTAQAIPGSNFNAGAVLANDAWYVISVKLEGQNTSGQYRLSFGQGSTAELSTLSTAVLMRSTAFTGEQWFAVGNRARNPAAAVSYQGDMAWVVAKVVARGTGVADALAARQTAQAAITGANLNYEENDAPYGVAWCRFALTELDAPKYRYAPGAVLAGGGATGFAVPDDTANSFVSVDVPDFRKADTYALMCDISIDGGVTFQFRDTMIPLARMGVKSIATMGTFDADSSYIVCQAGGYGGRWGGQPASNATTNRLGCNLVARAGDEIIDRVAFKAIAAESVPSGGWRVGNLRPIALRR